MAKRTPRTSRPRHAQSSSGKRNDWALRNLPSHAYCELRMPAVFREFITVRILPAIKLGGRNLANKREVALSCLHNLVLSGQRGHCIADSRSTADAAVRQRVNLWDAIVQAGFATKCTGSADSQRRTRYRITRKLSKLFDGWELQQLLDVSLARNSQMSEPTVFALVVTKGGKHDPRTGQLLPVGKQGQALPMPTAPPGIVNYVEWTEDRIEAVNLANLSHTWKAFRYSRRTGRRHVYHPNPVLRQVYSRKHGRGGRLYGFSPLNAQGLRKTRRRRLLIDDEPVAELDFSGFAPRFLYHLLRLDPKGDVYRPQKIAPKFYKSKPSAADKDAFRGFVKRATNILLNVTDMTTAEQAVRALVRKHKRHDLLCNVIYQTERTDPAGIVKRIVAAHPKLKRYFFADIGVRVQAIDGEIMLRILQRLTKSGRPALGIHDSVVCRVSDVRFTIKTMRDVYRTCVEFDPVISRAY